MLSLIDQLQPGILECHVKHLYNSTVYQNRLTCFIPFRLLLRRVGRSKVPRSRFRAMAVAVGEWIAALHACRLQKTPDPFTNSIWKIISHHICFKFCVFTYGSFTSKDPDQGLQQSVKVQHNLHLIDSVCIYTVLQAHRSMTAPLGYCSPTVVGYNN